MDLTLKSTTKHCVTYKRKFYINETFSWTNTTLSTADGARGLRLAFIVSPAKEKILSDGALYIYSCWYCKHHPCQLRQCGICLLLVETPTRTEYCQG